MGGGQNMTGRPHDDENIEAFAGSRDPEALSNLSLDAISNHRRTYFPAYGQAKTRMILVIRSHVNDEERASGTPTALGSAKLWRPQQTRALGEALRPEVVHFLKTLTESRLRPLARRAAKTFRPFLVCMRLRNPCLRTRRRFEGWNVRFIDSSGGTRLLPVSARTVKLIHETGSAHVAIPRTPR